MQQQDKNHRLQTHYPIIFISDMHLGMSHKASDLLCEFLDNITCDTLVLNGDIIDGRRLDARPPMDFPEGHKRVLDAIYNKKAHGSKLIYTPGNHDITLREMDNIFGKEICGIRFEKSFEYIDPKGRKLFVSHGDEFDVMEANVHKIPDALHTFADYFYIATTRVSNAIDRIANITLNRHFGLIRRFNSAVEYAIGKAQSNQKDILSYAEKNGYDGMVCGHTHIAKIKEKDGLLYLNSGDWVESFTALTLDQDNNWAIIQWPDMRRELGLKRHFNPLAHQNPNQACRPQTEELLTFVHSVWPGKQPKNKTTPLNP